MKISIVKLGVPLDIVLNKESKRKTPSIVSLRQGIRSFESNAVAAGTRYPQDTYISLKNLLGRECHDPEALEYKDQFANRITSDEERHTCSFQADDGHVYTVEELVAMQFLYAKHLAESFGGSETVNGAVITVPPYFNHFERQAVLDAADLAGIKVYGLMNDATAIALNYAMTRNFPTPQYHIIYDMGAGSTAASLVYFEDIVIKDGLFRNKTVPQVTVKAAGSDHKLGGHAIDRRLAKRFVEHFSEATGFDAAASPRAMAKLLKEASRVKQVLSANTQVVASVENLMDDVDFKLVVTRAELEADCKDVFEQVAQPIAKVLEEAGVGLQNVTSVILHGGGARIPATQAALRDYLGESMIAQNVNMDEAAVLGAGLRAAFLSKQFKVREIAIKDVNEFPIDIVYDAESSKDGGPRSLKMTLFHENGAMGAKKLMNFQRKTDFTFDLLYSNTTQTILRASVKGLTSALQTKSPLSIKVKSTIELSDSGTLHVRDAAVFLEFEKNATASGLFDKVSSFFGRKSDNDTASEDDQSKEEVGSTDLNVNKLSTKPMITPVVPSSKETTSVEQIKLDLSVEYLTFPPLPESLKTAAKRRFAKMDAEDRRRFARDEAKNTLEAFIYSARDFLEDTATHAISTIEQRTHFHDALHKAQSWLFDSTDDDATHDFTDRLQDLQKVHTPFVIRRTEKTKRPEAISTLHESLNGILEYIEKDNQTDSAVFAGLKDGVKQAKEWIATKQAEQDKLKDHETPVLLSSEIEAKVHELQTKFLMVVELTTSGRAKRPGAATTSGSAKVRESKETAAPGADEANAEQNDKDEL
ncbi:hypothetical protein SeLEV6574_g04387 [Synchytrium endobioticum]|nr:hypothetical protein SeLEV6574_g04387 [Synchytrium endobioticum]